MNEPLILVIDDDRTGRLFLASLLARDGYRLEFAEDGESGLLRARELQPDLILLDVVMPGMDGFEVCRRLRVDPQLAEVPILMLTALEDQESRLLGLEAGADDFISKPYRAPELRARVRTVTRLNRYRRLRAERARFAWVVENAEEGYLSVDSAGHLLYANARARALFGLSDFADQVVSVRQRLEEQFVLQPAEAWTDWPQLSGDKELFLVRSESQRAPAVWLAVRAQSYNTGDERETLLQLRDISAEKSSQRSVWSFESLISHKLRTPMTQITMGLSFLVQKAERLSVDKIKEFATMSRSGVDQLKREIDEILGYLNAPPAVPLGEGFALDRLPGLLAEVATQLEIQPVSLGQVSLSGTIQLSTRAFELMVWELLQNSKKFHPQNQPEIEVHVRLQEALATLEFRDDGSRLTPEQLHKAFLPYYQGEKGYTGQVPGMGLGLSMIRSLLWEIGGQCHLQNREDREGLVLQLQIPYRA